MVTRPLMDSIASITRPSWRNGVGSTHWLRQAKRTIMSGMGGCSSCRLDWGIHSLHGARSPCLMWVDDAVGLSHLRFGEGIAGSKQIGGGFWPPYYSYSHATVHHSPVVSLMDKALSCCFHNKMYINLVAHYSLTVHFPPDAPRTPRWPSLPL